MLFVVSVLCEREREVRVGGGGGAGGGRKQRPLRYIHIVSPSLVTNTNAALSFDPHSHLPS